MEFGRLLQIVADEPVFETGLLLAGNVDPLDIRRQLSRWVTVGKVLRLRRGLYALAPPYRKTVPHPFLVSNRLSHPSYVSLQSALAYYGHIPESVPVTTGLTTRRPERLKTPLGVYEFRHTKSELLFGFGTMDVSPGQRALVARPEKALLDIVHLTPNGDHRGFLEGLRLQALEQLDLERLNEYAERFRGSKAKRAGGILHKLIRLEAEEYETL